MKRAFYLRLAWDGIRKNKKLYIPYILTCVCMTAMFYIVSFLSKEDSVQNISGGSEIQGILYLGSVVIGIFSLLILFYTNSFLIRRRKKEFGLYNILGMNKYNLSRVLIWESIIVYAISLVCGLGFGILFSKFAELIMINILMEGTNFDLKVNFESIGNTAAWFLAIFVLILINSLRQIHISKPVELLKSENIGEKPPKANWVLAVLGAVILAAAYAIAVTVDNPMAAIFLYFVAVTMVIVATYMLFISGSVALCKALQKNKRYYYKTNHFVSVSGMVYRMKRNGAGLASICILSTMVLVMVSCTVCLYTGMEDSLRTSYPRDISVDVEVNDFAAVNDELVHSIDAKTEAVLGKYSEAAQNKMSYRIADVAANQNGNDFSIITNGFYSSSAYNVLIVPIEDYNRLMGQNETLAENEVLVYKAKLSDYDESTININGTGDLKIKKYVEDYIGYGVDMSIVNSSIYVFVPNYDAFIAQFEGITEPNGNPVLSKHYITGFDLDCDDLVQLTILNEIHDSVSSSVTDPGIDSVTTDGIAGSRMLFLGLYGGLFFLGILLGIVFIFAAVLIMYYKQISEGYEDRARFEIMRKVGMTQSEIKKSVNSQVLTVFFAPLIVAGIHLAFNFPLINKTITLLGFTNSGLLMGITAVCFLVFALLYVIVYRITSRSYYSIVSTAEKD
ncbi:MAG TPA: ABC transporter permease [Candidatus Eubacterium faecavium]|nr:ABC transporter permease [Candidatus Eubacterium faecavium]